MAVPIQSLQAPSLAAVACNAHLAVLIEWFPPRRQATSNKIIPVDGENPETTFPIFLFETASNLEKKKGKAQEKR